MYTLIRNAGVKRALADEAVPLLLSFGVAERFYKFHSFMLETGAFLLTWLVVSWVGGLVRSRFMGMAEPPPTRAVSSREPASRRA